MEIVLRAPLRFDQSIGYWTGEPDDEAFRRALTEVPPHPGVERHVGADRVTLRGPEALVREHARLLRQAGLL